MGAVIGSRVGLVLGLLEGIVNAVPDNKEMEKLLVDARRELDVLSVFGRDYWNEEGVWRYEVREEDGEDVLFKDVAMAHPLLSKWEGLVREVTARWGVDLDVLGEEGEQAGQEREGKQVKREVKDVAKSKEILDW